MIKLLRGGGALRIRAMAGIDPASDELARAARLGVATTADGVDGLLALPRFGEIGVVFDATSASAHEANAKALAPYDVRVVDLTPAEPPLIMRDTVYCLVAVLDADVRAAIAEAVTRMVADVAGYVPGYRLKQPVQVTEIDGDVTTLADGVTHKVTVLLEVE